MTKALYTPPIVEYLVIPAEPYCLSYDNNDRTEKLGRDQEEDL